MRWSFTLLKLLFTLILIIRTTLGSCTCPYTVIFTYTLYLRTLFNLGSFRLVLTLINYWQLKRLMKSLLLLQPNFSSHYDLLCLRYEDHVCQLGSITIASEDSLLCSQIQLCSYFSGNMTVCSTTKDSKMSNLWLLPCKCFFRNLCSQHLVSNSIMDIHYICATRLCP